MIRVYIELMNKYFRLIWGFFRYLFCGFHEKWCWNSVGDLPLVLVLVYIPRISLNIFHHVGQTIVIHSFFQTRGKSNNVIISYKMHYFGGMMSLGHTEKEISWPVLYEILVLTAKKKQRYLYWIGKQLETKRIKFGTILGKDTQWHSNQSGFHSVCPAVETDSGRLCLSECRSFRIQSKLHQYRCELADYDFGIYIFC